MFTGVSYVYRGKLCLQGLVMITGVSYDYKDNLGLQG